MTPREADTIVDEVARYAERELWPQAARHDEESLWVGPHLPRMAGLGLMGANLPVRLRVLIPAVENAISGAALRPRDVIWTRAGKTASVPR